MNTAYRKRFLKDLARLPAGVRRKVEFFAFEALPQLDSLGESGKIEKMQGYPGHFKIRFGSYRVGLRLKDETVYVERVLHRKDIYRYYP